MSHNDWVSVGDLPGTRIEWRYERKGRRYEFFDETGTIVGNERNDYFCETASEMYVFSTAGLQRFGSDTVVIPWATRRIIEMPDGRRLGVWFKGRWRQRWAVLKVLGESGDPLVAVRWTAQSHPWKDLNVFSTPRYKRRGEAVIAPGMVRTTEPVLFAAYAIRLLLQATYFAPVASG